MAEKDLEKKEIAKRAMGARRDDAEPAELTLEDRTTLLNATRALVSLEEELRKADLIDDEYFDPTAVHRVGIMPWLDIATKSNDLPEFITGRGDTAYAGTEPAPPAIDRVRDFAEMLADKMTVPQTQYKTAIFKCIGDYDACLKKRNTPNVCAAIAVLCVIKHITPFVRHRGKD
jgi:hypothetical protein